MIDNDFVDFIPLHTNVSELPVRRDAPDYEREDALELVEHCHALPARRLRVCCTNGLCCISREILTTTPPHACTACGCQVVVLEV